MSQTLTIIILLAASIAGSGLIVYALMIGTKRQGALRDAVAARGWRYDRDEGTAGRARVTTISDPNAGWQMEIKVNAATTGSGRTVRSTTWSAADAGISQGLAIIGPSMSAEKAERAETMLAKLGGGMGGFLMDKLFGDLGPEAARLEAVDLPGAHGLLMATPEAQAALVPVATHPALAKSAGLLPGGTLPVIRRSDRGLEISLRAALSRPEEVLALADLGETLRQALPDS